jgi:Arc/MetJ-type ribon-helix-helix transcriptional regulator
VEETVMVQRQLTLSDDANAYIQQQLETGQFATPDEVVSKTLEEAQLAAAKKKLAELIREGMESGDGQEVNEEWRQSIRARIQAEAERRQSA